MHTSPRTRSSWNFGALLWRARHRTWQRFRKREMPQRGGERGVVPSVNRGRENGGVGTQYAAQTLLSLVRERRVRRRNWRELSYFRPVRKQKTPARVWKVLSDWDKPPDDLSIYFLRTIERLKIQCSSCTRLIVRLFYVMSIDRVETVDDVNKLHRSCTVRWYRKFDARTFLSTPIDKSFKGTTEHFEAHGRLESVRKLATL